MSFINTALTTSTIPLPKLDVADIATILLDVLTLLGLVITWYIMQSDRKYKRSQSFLDNAQECFVKSVKLISHKNNDAIKWHRAIYSIREAVNIAKNITIDEHRQIYVASYFDTVLAIGIILEKIDSLKFFYGIINYKDMEDFDLYDLCYPKELKTESYDISEFQKDNEKRAIPINPALLSYLSRFLDKANKVAVKKEGFKTTLSSYSRNQFHELSLPISEEEMEFQEINNSQMYINNRVIIKYLHNHKICEKNRKQN